MSFSSQRPKTYQRRQTMLARRVFPRLMLQSSMLRCPAMTDSLCEKRIKSKVSAWNTCNSRPIRRRHTGASANQTEWNWLLGRWCNGLLDFLGFTRGSSHHLCKMTHLQPVSNESSLMATDCDSDLRHPDWEASSGVANAMYAWALKNLLPVYLQIIAPSQSSWISILFIASFPVTRVERSSGVYGLSHGKLILVDHAKSIYFWRWRIQSWDVVKHWKLP